MGLPANFGRLGRFEQGLEALFAILAELPGLTSLTLGEPPPDGWCPDPIVDRLPAELAGLRALERLSFVDLHGAIALPALREISVEWATLEATEHELETMFPGARISRSIPWSASPE